MVLRLRPILISDQKNHVAANLSVIFQTHLVLKKYVLTWPLPGFYNLTGPAAFKGLGHRIERARDRLIENSPAWTHGGDEDGGSIGTRTRNRMVIGWGGIEDNQVTVQYGQIVMVT